MIATRLVNIEVPLDAVQRLLDHNSPEMTARYAQITDQTLRRELERYQQRINIRGEIVPLDPERAALGRRVGRRTSHAPGRRSPTAPAASPCSRPARTPTPA
jgi:hypothetical protein